MHRHGDAVMLDDLSSAIEPPYGNGNVPRSRQDEFDLARFGKKPQLKRNFKLLSIIGLTSTLMITWEGSLSTFQGGLQNGGPAVLVYGFIYVWLGTFLQAAVMGELASMVPLSGGAYNWVAVLSPPWCSKFLSYLTGWMSVISWQTALASSALLGGTMIQGLITLNYPNYVFERWHGTLLFYAIIFVSLIVNTYLARILPEIEAIVLFFHVAGFFVVLIPLVYYAPHGSASSVFTTLTHESGWSSGISFLIGMSTCMFSFIGCDAATHMAEEIQLASKVIPRSMLISVALNGALGFSMVIAMLFCLGDEASVLTTATHFPFIQVFTNATQSNLGGTLMSCIIIMSMIFAAIGLLATSSRMAWAFAREGGLPGSTVLARVNEKTKLPIYTICLSTVISLLLAVINIGSSTAFNALTSLVIASFYGTFILSAGVLLYQRLTVPKDHIPFGPFTLGRFGVPLIIISIVYSSVGIFFSFWPPSPKPDAVTMNWSIVVFGGTLILSMVFWALYGRKVYKGPLTET